MVLLLLLRCLGCCLGLIAAIGLNVHKGERVLAAALDKLLGCFVQAALAGLKSCAELVRVEDLLPPCDPAILEPLPDRWAAGHAPHGGARLQASHSLKTEGQPACGSYESITNALCIGETSGSG